MSTGQIIRNFEAVVCPRKPEVLTIGILAVHFLADAKLRYAPRESEPNNELKNVTKAIEPLLDAYSTMAVADFQPIHLRAIQQWFITCTSLSCSTINGRVKRIRRVFHWAVKQGWLSESVASGLKRIDPVRPPQAPMSLPVEPVDYETVQATLKFIGPIPAVMLNVMQLCACRPGEIIRLSKEYIEIQGEIAIYRPPHKTMHLGKQRVIILNKQALAMVAPYLLKYPKGPCFHTVRGTPWTTDALRNSVARACCKALEKGKIKKAWSPNQIRHYAITACIEKAGKYVAQIVAGHASIKTTETYAHTIQPAIQYAQQHG